MRLGILAVFATTIAHAEPAVTKRALVEAPSNTVYVELLGKAGPYGLGYERRITERLWLGVAASYANVRGQQIATAAPYVHVRLLGDRNSLFTEPGAVFVQTRIPSPVPEWDGMSDSGGGGFASLGWQRSWTHLIVRAHGSVMVGEGGATPWLGAAIGYTR